MTVSSKYRRSYSSPGSIVSLTVLTLSMVQNTKTAVSEKLQATAK